MTTAFANPFRPINPFLPEGESTLVDIDVEPVDGREVSYAFVATGPAVPADEVESHLDAIEVKVTWGTQVLSLTHLEPGKSFTVGEGGDFVLPTVDGSRTAVVEQRNGVSYVVVPLEGKGTVSARGEHPRQVAGGDEITLADGMTVRIEMADDIVVEIASVRAGKKVPVGFLAALASGAAACIGLSFVGHAAIVASLAMFMPKMNADDAEAISREQMLSMRAMMDAAAQREPDEVKSLDPGSEANGGGSQGGEPHQGESGAAGTTKPVATKGHMAFKGNDDHAQLSRADELALARESGFIGILLASAPKDGPTSPWVNDPHMGTDAESKIGALWGADPNDAMGIGLGLWGTGEGGGGKGKGIGIDGVGDAIGGGGHGPGKWGIGLGDKDGIGIGHGPGKGGHIVKSPSVRPPPTIETNGRLPAEVIQRIVRQNFGRFRMCYEAGLRNNPGLQGRVVTKFVIGRDGSVAQASDAGSDLANQEVINCVVRSYSALSFPSPEGGIATVVYPISLSPGE
jgi:hypothetical protein